MEKGTGSHVHLSDGKRQKYKAQHCAHCIRNHVIRNFHVRHEQVLLKVIYSMATRYYGDDAV